ncbi:MAG: PRC-barrel domain-containing protein [Rubrobacteraceae bacterium]
MHSVNGIFGREVVNESTGEKLAKVQNIVFDEDSSTIVALLIPGDRMLGGSRVVRWNLVSSIGDVIVVRDSELVDLKEDTEVAGLSRQSHQITGTEIVTEGGEKIGAVSDLLVDDRGAVIGYEVKQGLLGGRDFLPVEKVRSAGRDAIIAEDADLPSMKDVLRG